MYSYVHLNEHDDNNIQSIPVLTNHTFHIFASNSANTPKGRSCEQSILYSVISLIS